MDKLDEMVFLAIGRAQACGDDEERSYKIGKQLVTAIREYIQEKTQQPAPTYVSYLVYPYTPVMPYHWTCGTKQDAGTVAGDYTDCNPKGY